MCLDIDDTLVDFTRSARCALSALIGRDDMWPIWVRTTEEHVARVVAGELDYVSMHAQRTKAFLAELGALIDDDVAGRLEEHRRQMMRSNWRLFGDVLPCLDWLRAAGVRIAAVTNASGGHQRAKLASLGLAGFVDHVVIAGELGVAKPEPGIFHEACRVLGVHPEETAHVGDRLELDAIGARDAGLCGVWLDRVGEHDPAEDAERLPRGVHVVSSLASLPELLVCEFAAIAPVASVVAS
ncbi:MAG: HAD-IA family hydrolase [Pseudonocardiaceae bacterium]|nr:HAD-IA family hydrolase [Pseudonocardiaceae bacterium]